MRSGVRNCPPLPPHCTVTGAVWSCSCTFQTPTINICTNITLPPKTLYFWDSKIKAMSRFRMVKI